MPLQTTTKENWLRILEGVRRGLIPKYKWELSISGNNEIRELRDSTDNSVVARMTVTGSKPLIDTASSARTYVAEPGVVTLVASIVIPTEEQWRGWDVNDDFSGFRDLDPGWFDDGQPYTPPGNKDLV